MHILKISALASALLLAMPIAAFADPVMSGPLPPSVMPAFAQYTDYDELGRVRQVLNAEGAVVAAYTYDNNGNVLTVTDAVNRVTTYTYDALDRVATVKDYAGNLTTFTYDANDQLVSVKDPRGFTTSYVRDGFGDVWVQQSPDTGTTSFARNAAGLVDAETRNDGSVISYTYDGQGRLLTAVKDAADTRTFTYDNCANGIGMLCTATTGTGTGVEFTYTPEGQVATRYDYNNQTGAKDTTAYAYNGLGQLTAISYPSGISMGYAYADGRLALAQVTVGGTTKTVISNLTYQPFGAVNGWTYGNGLERLYNIDPNGRVTGISAGTPNSIVQSLTYGINNANEITAITNGIDASQNRNYQYDAAGRLMADTASGEQWHYDKNGNRNFMQGGGSGWDYVVDNTSNRVLSYTNVWGTRSYGYNLLGQRTSESAPSGNRAYTYDAFGAMRTATVDGRTTSYTSNALGQRVRKSGIARYVYAGQNQLLAEYGPGGWTNYLWLGGELVGVVKPDQQVRYVHNDHLGRPEIVTDAAQATVWRANNQAWGRSIITDQISGLNVGFPGQYFDAESGLWYNGFRDYDQVLGRYLQSDPIGLGSGVNTYAYANGTPVSLVDYNGLEGIGPWTFPPGPQRDAVIAAQNGPRGPDFVQVSVSLYVFGGSATVSRSGNVFLSGGVARNYPNPVRGFGLSVNAGTLMTSCPDTTRRASLTDRFLTGLGYSATAHNLIGGGVAYSPGSGGATLVGFGAGVEVSPGAVGAQAPLSFPGW